VDKKGLILTIVQILGIGPTYWIIAKL